MIFNELPVNGHVCDEVLKVNGLQTDFLHDLIGPFICDIMQYDQIIDHPGLLDKVGCPCFVHVLSPLLWDIS